MIAVQPKPFNALKARDQIVRGVRQRAPIEDESAVTDVVLPRHFCPSLTERTWEDVNLALPIGWGVIELNAATFTVTVLGRRA